MKLPRLRQVREEKGLAPIDLCEAAMMPLERLEAIESGRKGVYPATAEKLALALGVSVDDLRDPARAAMNRLAHELKNADRDETLKRLRQKLEP